MLIRDLGNGDAALLWPHQVTGDWTLRARVALLGGSGRRLKATLFVRGWGCSYAYLGNLEFHGLRFESGLGEANIIKFCGTPDPQQCGGFLGARGRAVAFTPLSGLDRSVEYELELIGEGSRLDFHAWRAGDGRPEEPTVTYTDPDPIPPSGWMGFGMANWDASDGVILRSFEACPGRDDEPPPAFRRGDCNDDGTVNISDAVRDLRFCFGAASVPCAVACDIDGDGNPCTGVTDGVRLLMYLFRGGDAPPAPFPECGTVEGEVDCETPPVNCQ